MDISAYFHRIGYNGAAKPDLHTLKAIHRAHVFAIPFENLDVQLGRPISAAPEAVFDKIVSRRRGGWCYEMNGLFGWALETIGFDVIRLAGAVDRISMGDKAIGNHLALIVMLDEPWLADAGFGMGLVEPTPLKEGRFLNGFLSSELQRIEDGWWRYVGHEHGDASTYDFHPNIRDETLLDKNRYWLQHNAQSPFVMNLVAQRWREHEHVCLRGRVLTRQTRAHKTKETLPDQHAYVAVLRDAFGLEEPDAASLWPQICNRHEALFSRPSD